jgi:hypothetical protein
MKKRPFSRCSTICLVLGLLVLWNVPDASAAPIPALRLPTENNQLFGKGGAAFFQAVERNFRNKTTYPWEGGRFGYVRNPIETAHGIVFMRFHEGIDIAPMRRDIEGNPLDPVMAVDGGRVVFVNTDPAKSNYGIYVVVEHRWGDGPFYSLYGHLAAAQVNGGEEVVAGQTLGRMGYTGSGAVKLRAHLHFEINLLLNPHFDQWYAQQPNFTEPNWHGIYNGLNLFGMNVEQLYLACRQNPALDCVAFLRSQPCVFTVRFPADGPLPLLEMYPWLLQGNPLAQGQGGWELDLTGWGFPLALRSVSQKVGQATLVRMAPSQHPYEWSTRSMVTGKGKRAELSRVGVGYLQLLTFRP